MKSRVQSNKKDPSNINTLQVSNITLVEYLWFHEYITQVALVKLNFIKTTFLFTRKYRITKFKITNQYLQTVLKTFGLLQKSVTSSWWVFFFPLKSHDVPNRNYFNSLLSGLQFSQRQNVNQDVSMKIVVASQEACVPLRLRNRIMAGVRSMIAITVFFVNNVINVARCTTVSAVTKWKRTTLEESRGLLLCSFSKPEQIRPPEKRCTCLVSGTANA